MATQSEQYQSAQRAKIQKQLEAAKATVATAGYDADIAFKVVPVKFALRAEQKAGSTLTEQEFQDLLTLLNLKEPEL